jgi:hypothetical protein
MRSRDKKHTRGMQSWAQENPLASQPFNHVHFPQGEPPSPLCAVETGSCSGTAYQPSCPWHRRPHPLVHPRHRCPHPRAQTRPRRRCWRRCGHACEHYPRHRHHRQRPSCPPWPSQPAPTPLPLGSAGRRSGGGGGRKRREEDNGWEEEDESEHLAKHPFPFPNPILYK